MSRTNNEAAAKLFSALGDSTRLTILGKLGNDAHSATTLAEGAKVTRQAIVRHLQVLEGAGLVTTQKRGRDVLYLVQPQKLQDAQEYLEMVAAKWDKAIDRLKMLVEG